MLNTIDSQPSVHESDVSIIRREFVDLTGNLFSAVILNQLLYWTLRVKDFDYLLEEERRFQPNCNVSPRHGWIYKTAQELNEETMLGLSPPSIRKYLKLLIDEGWIDERNHPTEKWDRTTQYRVNLKQLQEDLIDKGRSLPEVYLKAFGGSFPKKSIPHNVAENREKIADEKNFASKERDFSSNENLDVPYDDESDFSKETLNQRNFASNEKTFASNEKTFGSNTENTTENTNKEKALSACVREEICLSETCLKENFYDCENLGSRASPSTSPAVDGSGLNESVSHKPALLGSPMDASALEEPPTNKAVPGRPVQDGSVSDESASGTSVVDEMLSLWKHHVVLHLPIESEKRQKALHLTDKQKDQLESLFAFHFKNDMRLWEQFCLRVKASSFLMGHGARKWTIDPEWILKEGNFSKILSGKYDNSRGAVHQDSCDWKLEKAQPNPALNAEKAAILASIKDPVWKKWCTQLAQGVSLNEFKMLHGPLSVLQLEQIANARFLEVEDDRLVWMGSSDQAVLNALENLRLKISWVFAKEYPKATTFRTRLDTQFQHGSSVSAPSSPSGESL